ncbi:RmlC-like cupin domain-containing protein [Leptodontidium sp. MPI-SDFR-AT-0119]|nr:RmlC-like cupin domain-containing protein [Leptodontidium sp. MPI-SDFR-AT-0119]
MSSNSKPPQQPPAGIRDPSRRTLTNHLIKDNVYIEKYGTETNSAYTQVRVTVAPGGGTPLHYHGSYEEHLTCTNGLLSCVVGKKTLTFTPGETAVIPIGTRHRFFNNSENEGLEFMAKVVPAHEGFEKSLYICYGLAEDGKCDEKGLPKSFVHLCLMADLGDMKWPGFMLTAGLGNMIVKVVAAYGRWSGEEERLLMKYWY